MTLRTLWVFWTSSIAAEMEYRINFLTSSINSAGNLFGTMYMIWLLYRKGYSFSGWSWHQSLLILALFHLLGGLANALLSPNLARIVHHVQRGTLDFVLLKPIDAQLQVSLRNFSLWGVPNVLMALALLIYASLNLNLSWINCLLGILPVILSAIILYCLWFAVATTTIWFTKIWNATEVLRAFTDVAQFPMTAYPSIFQFVFTFILPLAFLTTVPAEIIRGTRGPDFILIQAAIAAALLIATRLFWKFALRSYTSASS